MRPVDLHDFFRVDLFLYRSLSRPKRVDWFGSEVVDLPFFYIDNVGTATDSSSTRCTNGFAWIILKTCTTIASRLLPNNGFAQGTWTLYLRNRRNKFCANHVNEYS